MHIISTSWPATTQNMWLSIRKCVSGQGSHPQRRTNCSLQIRRGLAREVLRMAITAAQVRGDITQSHIDCHLGFSLGDMSDVAISVIRLMQQSFTTHHSLLSGPKSKSVSTASPKMLAMCGSAGPHIRLPIVFHAISTMLSK